MSKYRRNYRHSPFFTGLFVILGVIGLGSRILNHNVPIQHSYADRYSSNYSNGYSSDSNATGSQGYIGNSHWKSVTDNHLPAHEGNQDAIILNYDQPTMKIGKTTTSYVHNQLLSNNRPGTMNAVLTKKNRFYVSRNENRNPHTGAYTNPVGWRTIQISDKTGSYYLYNRSHLLGYAMANFKGFDYSEYNHKNVITGTAAFNQSSKWGMNYFEDKVRTGLDEGMTIRYQVTPIYKNGDLLARGVHMQAKAVKGGSLRYNAFVYNVQPGVTINYQTGQVKY